jgi:two-component system, cell cycle sensor histidine kinase and response regulator CckA
MSDIRKPPVSTDSPPSFIKRLVAGVLLLNLFVYALAALSLLRSWHQYEARVETSTQNLSRILENSIGGIVGKANVAILGVVDEAERQLAAGKIDRQTLDRCIARQSARVPELDSIRMADGEGNVVYGSGTEPGSPVNIADREYFRQVRDNPQQGTFISKPYFGRIAKKWAFSQARRVNHPDGAFAGVAFGVFSIEFFTRLFSSLDVGRDGTIVLRDQDLAVVARYPEPGGLGSSIGQISWVPPLIDLIQAGNLSATYKRVATVDKINRIYSYRKIPDLPFYVFVGQSISANLDDLRKDALALLSLAPLFTLVTLLFSGMLLLKWRREKQVEAELRTANQELELRVEERTTALRTSNEQLQVELAERKQVETELKASEERSRNLFEHAPVGIFHSDRGGRFLAANPALAKMLGYSSPEELIAVIADMTTQIYSDPEVRPQIMDALMKQDGWVHYDEVLWRRKDGSLITVDMTGRKVLSSTGAIAYLEGFIEDITERKRAEEEGLRLGRQLQQMQKAESLGRMAGAIAHHFNNQLGAVMGNLELAALNLPQGAKAQANIAHAMTASGRAAEISRLMLTYLGQSNSVRAPIELLEICREALPLLTAALPKKVHLKTEFPAEGPLILADAGQVRQILTNLVVNAGEAMEDREGDVTVAVRVIAAAGIDASQFYPPEWEPREESYACLAVADTGCGIDQESLKLLFDPFFSTKFTGRGLGLPIVLGMVKAHGGAISVESVPDRGTVFRVFLPFSAGQLRELPKAGPVASVSLGDHGLLLLVEDEPAMRNMAETMLKVLGYKVMAAADGVEAVEVFREHRDQIQCVLLDLTMPRMDGWETLTALRALRPNLPVILASGYDEARAMAGDHAERPQAFLQKPYQMAELEAAIEAVVKGPTRAL